MEIHVESGNQGFEDNLKANRLKNKIRKELSVQRSGEIKVSRISLLKESEYYPVDVPLDGDAPKEYIKAYFYYKDCPRKVKPLTWNGFYAKFGGKSYPHESVVEYAINRVGEALGLDMNETKLVVANGQIRFLSKDFVIPGKTRLIHGTEILAEYFEDKDFVDEINKNRKERREYLTFDVIESALLHVYPRECENLLEGLVKLITFDAIVGNNDRHFYNWGVIGRVRKGGAKAVTLAPIYDSARGLFWNHTEQKVINFHESLQKGTKELEAYVNRSKPRFSYEGNPKANHFDLIEFLAKDNNYRPIIVEMVGKDKESCVINALRETVLPLYSHERLEITEAAIGLRFKKLRAIF